jgi:hypothetical protein
MAAGKKSWREKFQTRKAPELKRTQKAFADVPIGATMLIASPQIVEDYLYNIPPGRQVEPKTLRQDLALEYGAQCTCPVTTGIFIRIVAEANYEAWQQGEKAMAELAPFWRVISPETAMAAKLSCGSDFIKQRLDEEQQ